MLSNKCGSTCLAAIPVAIVSLCLLAVVVVAIDSFAACGGRRGPRYARIEYAYTYSSAAPWVR